MRVSREEAARNRERIVEAAARRFRERGFEGIGVADVMKEAGLTHGGFYGHFGSKEDLMAEACTLAITQSRQLWAKRAQAAGGGAVEALGRLYLTTRHRDDPGRGCVLAALGADAARQGPGVRQALTAGLRGVFDFLAGLMHSRSAEARRRKAITTYASWVGAMVLARGVDDDALSREILDAVAQEARAG
ncbi:MAG TPA: TetR/AcrR family transcriptional regulator [Usitatibacter sp.]|nr:TetR/AcrR family transcriptional regulator [Usitatibacter sp.]